MLKKLVPAILVVAMMFTISACGKKIRGSATKDVKQVKSDKTTVLQGTWVRYIVNGEDRIKETLIVNYDLMMIELEGETPYYANFMVSEKNGKHTIIYLDEYYNPTYSETFELKSQSVIFENGDLYEKQ